MAGETIMSVVYGLPIKQKDDVYIQLAEVGINALQAASVPGASLVDLIPWLKYVPEWMPGAGFKRKAREWDVLARRMVDLPFADAQKRTAEGCSTPSFTSISMQRVDDGTRDEAYQDHVIRGSAGTLYAAGTDTTVSAIASCILGLLENPEIIRKAQAKFDSVIKPGHLPDFTDEKNLSFITALTMESLRWRDVVPIAIPRYLQVDDEYKGYKLPKGSIVIPNAWAMLHDENVYSDPFVFNPERLLTKDGKINKAVVPSIFQTNILSTVKPAYSCQAAAIKEYGDKYDDLITLTNTVAEGTVIPQSESLRSDVLPIKHVIVQEKNPKYAASAVDISDKKSEADRTGIGVGEKEYIGDDRNKNDDIEDLRSSDTSKK
ncbi:O-methylsterigmatocystin oxidoreductase [Leucoagaricus sp. SymC.cos]|nr:O-methylsterigmatocystin oxidoreductase [Leucoagaricus sp. SymC.cos]